MDIALRGQRVVEGTVPDRPQTGTAAGIIGHDDHGADALADGPAGPVVGRRSTVERSCVHATQQLACDEQLVQAGAQDLPAGQTGGPGAARPVHG